MIHRFLRSQDAGWPIALLFVGLPIWWVLGVWQIMFFVMAIPMAVHLMKQRLVHMPRGFGMWMVWLCWLAIGVLVIQVDAPGAVPGTQMSRYLTFGYRFCWYLIITIVALYVVNTRRLVTSERLARSIAWLFVMMVGGGMLGVLVPELSLPSALQMVLPSSVASQPFVHDLVHIQTAQIQNFLGYDEARPSAPFAYTNEWGLTTAVSLPFFVASWSRGSTLRKTAMLVILGLGLFTIVSSLNRGMWAAVAAMGAFLVIRAASKGHFKLLFSSGMLLVGVAAVLMFSSLGDLVLARFDNPHSNEGRTNLGLLSVNSTLEGSPLVGFGSTRDVAGNFKSIAGGATDACPKCEPPPLGTQGQLWLVIFGAGLIGLALYLGFMLRQIVQNLRATSAEGTAALCALIALLITMPVYNAVGVGLYVGFIGIGLLAREHPAELPAVSQVLRPFRQHALTVLVIAIAGGAAGLGVHVLKGAPIEATQRIFVPAADLVGVPGVRTLSLDGEARIATSVPVVRAVADELDLPEQHVRSALSIGAESNSRVLILRYAGADERDAILGVETAAEEYLRLRTELIAQSNESVVARYSAREEALDDVYRDISELTETARGESLWGTVTKIRRERVEVADVLLGTNDLPAGQVISAATPRRTNSELTIRVTTGLGLGALAGLALVLVYDRYLGRIGLRPVSRLGIDIPVVASVSAADVPSTLEAVRAYLPVAGVLADPLSPRARRMAGALNAHLRAGDHTGARVLLVIDRRSRTGTLRRAYERHLASGVYPVGLIMCTDSRSREPNADTRSRSKVS